MFFSVDNEEVSFSKTVFDKAFSARKYVRLSGGKLSTTQGKPFVIYQSGKAKKVGSVID